MVNHYVIEVLTVFQLFKSCHWGMNCKMELLFLAFRRCHILKWGVDKACSLTANFNFVLMLCAPKTLVGYLREHCWIEVNEECALICWKHTYSWVFSKLTKNGIRNANNTEIKNQLRRPRCILLLITKVNYESDK